MTRIQSTGFLASKAQTGLESEGGPQVLHVFC